MKMKTPPTFKDTNAAVVLYRKGIRTIVPEIARYGMLFRAAAIKCNGRDIVLNQPNVKRYCPISRKGISRAGLNLIDATISVFGGNVIGLLGQDAARKIIGDKSYVVYVELTDGGSFVIGCNEEYYSYIRNQCSKGKLDPEELKEISDYIEQSLAKDASVAAKRENKDSKDGEKSYMDQFRQSPDDEFEDDML